MRLALLKGVWGWRLADFQRCPVVQQLGMAALQLPGGYMDMTVVSSERRPAA